MKTKITFFSPIDSFISILFRAHQQSFTKYFEAVFIGIFRTLPNMESFARVWEKPKSYENNYERIVMRKNSIPVDKI